MNEEEELALLAENAGLRESVRILEHRNADLFATIMELENAPSQRPIEKSRWFGYKSADGNQRGAFDMLMVCGWKAKLVRVAWRTTVYSLSGVFELDDAQSKEFWERFDKYLNRE